MPNYIQNIEIERKTKNGMPNSTQNLRSSEQVLNFVTTTHLATLIFLLHAENEH